MRSEEQFAPDEHGRYEHESVSELFGEVKELSAELVRKEIALGVAEIEKIGKAYVDSAKKLGVALALAGGAAVCGLATLLCLIYVTLVLGFSVAPAVSLWVSPLLVGLVLGILAFSLYRSGKLDAQNIEPVPRTTLRNVKEDLACLKTERRK